MPEWKKDPNEIGAAWKKTNDKGEYLSVALDLDALLVLTGGATGKIDLSMYPIESENPKAPAYRLKYYPRRGASERRPLAAPLDEDDIPF
jgi:uncharacterized protein (DUF736 family)